MSQAHLQHTDSQTQDWLHLRQLFYHKVGQLARERKALLANMTQNKVEMSHVSDKLARMTSWSDQLRNNGKEEHRAYLQFQTAFYRGVNCYSNAPRTPYSFLQPVNCVAYIFCPSA